MDKRVKKCYKRHKEALGYWEHGEPKKYWLDDYGTLCIEYEDGSWWHYGGNGGALKWW